MTYVPIPSPQKNKKRKCKRPPVGRWINADGNSFFEREPLGSACRVEAVAGPMIVGKRATSVEEPLGLCRNAGVTQGHEPCQPTGG